MRTSDFLSGYIMTILLSLIGLRSTASVIEHSTGYVVKPLGLEKGLSSNHVMDIIKDRNGFMWFATEEGLNRFDGSQFYTYYKKLDGTGISGNELSCLLADPHDPIIWIGTQREGLNAYNYLKEKFVYYRHNPKDPSSLITNDITDIAAARDGNIWISTYWNGIELFNKKTEKFTHFNKKTIQNLASNQVWCIMDAGGDLLYVGHVEAGMSIINTRTHTARNFRHNMVQPGSLSSDNINCIYQDRSGHIWIGTDSGLDLFNPIKEEFIHINAQGQLRYRVYAIAEMNDGRLFIGTEFGGITIISPKYPKTGGVTFPITGHITEGSKTTDLSGSTIRSICQDKYNNIWIGTYGAGVNFITSQLPTINQINCSANKANAHLSNNTVFGIASDRSGNLWLGTDGSGLSIFSPTGQRIAERLMQAGICVQTAHCDSRGTLWFGSYKQGAWVKTENKDFKRVVGLPQFSDVRGFHEDSKGKIWIATSTGVYVADGLTHRVIDFPLKLELVRSVCTDRRGRVWIGTFDDGLHVYSPQLKLLRSFSVSKHFPSNNVNHIICDHQGRMWVSTGDGIALFPNRNSLDYRIYNIADGLNNSHVRALTEDQEGNIWASTNKGISCLVKGCSSFINFTYMDNLPMGNFNDASVTVQADGTLIFGSTGGAARFHPKRVLAHRPSPEVLITDALLPSRINGKEDSIINLIGKNKLKLSYQENTFSLRFNIQNYALVDRVEYAYMLKGTRDEWVELGLHEVTFRDVPYGKYTLLAKCRLRNQPWPAQYAKIAIEITPPFWLSWPAKLLYALLVAAVIVALLRFYNRKIRLEYLYQSEKRHHEHEQELNQERLRFYTNITHELRTPLTLIMGPLEDISHDSEIPKDSKRKLAIIHDSAKRLNSLISQILEFRKTETENRRLCVSRDDIVGCVHEICLKYEELNRKDLVNIRFTMSDAPIEIYFDKEVVMVIVDNLVSNAIKYTDRGEIVVSVDRSFRNGKNMVDISVTDTGHGISADALPHIFDRYYQENGPYQASGTGIGLAMVKKLVELHHGTITVDSTPEKGSCFCISLHADEVYPNCLHKERDVHKTENNVTEATVKATDGSEPTGKELPIVVVVEDNKDIRDYIAESFAPRYDVRTAENGRAGLALALAVTPDIVISDIMMPEMDGNELCKRLKADVRTSHIPVILLTAKDATSAKEEGYEAGADSYLTKPFTTSLLETRVRNLLNQRRMLLQGMMNLKNATLVQKQEQLREALSEIDREFYDKVNTLIEARISGDVDVNYLADNLNMSTSTLYRKMKAVMGVSTNEYIRKYKMHYAEKILLEGKCNISETCFMVGINSVSYFRKCFKDEFGMLPSEYIKKIRSTEKEE